MRNLHGFKDEDFGFRFSNEANVKKYVTGTKGGLNIKKTEEVLTRQAAMEEFCFLALRKTEGISPNRFKIKFGVDIGSIYAEVIDKLKREGLLEVSDISIKLTERGMKYGNRAFSEFLLSP